MRLTIALLAPAILAACTTGPEYTAYQVEQDRAYCMSLGFSYEGSAECILALQRDRAASQQANLALAGALMSPTAAPARPVHCTTNRSGNYLNTTCY